MKSYSSVTKDDVVTDIRNVEVEESIVVTTSTVTTLAHIDARRQVLRDELSELDDLRKIITVAAGSVKLKEKVEEVI